MNPSPTDITTSFQAEREEQQRWKLLPEFSGLKTFTRLMANEFVPEEQHQASQLKSLKMIAKYSSNRVPYYQQQFKKAGIKAADLNHFSDITRLPILGKLDLLQHFDQLQALQLPRGQKLSTRTASSGTTGRPVTVVQTRQSMRTFSIFWQRQARWLRQDPTALAARIRLPETLPKDKDGSLLPDGCTYTRSRWSHIGRYFLTGPEIGCNLGNSREWQIRWLQEHQPKYLQSFPGIFEELALANNQEKPVDSLESLMGVAALLTDSMQSLIERVFEAPIHQNYGMNEVGIVAARCPGGRYHIHNEHCIVEIVDDEGQAVSPGEIGRIVITTFRNFAMPLLRYDCGDMASAVEGPCPCGRTTPSIGLIAGRHRRFACLPKGTRPRYNSIFNTIESMAPDCLKNLRQYQVHQNRDHSFDLLIRTAGPMAPEFLSQIQDAWVAVTGEEGRDQLRIQEVDSIDAAPGGKLLEFTSDFYPESDTRITDAGRTQKT